MALFSFGNMQAGKRGFFFFFGGEEFNCDLPQGLHDTQGFRLALVSLDQAQTRVRDSQKVDVGVLLASLHHHHRDKIEINRLQRTIERQSHMTYRNGVETCKVKRPLLGRLNDVTLERDLVVTISSVRRVNAVVIEKQLHSTPVFAADPYASLVVSVVHHLTEDEVQGERMRKGVLRWRE